MAIAYDPRSWSELFVATAGAVAALTGLLFVAVSVNIERILKLPGLPERGALTLLLLLSAVVVSVIALIPGQSAEHSRNRVARDEPQLHGCNLLHVHQDAAERT
jgi:hypothetical protein